MTLVTRMPGNSDRFAFDFWTVMSRRTTARVQNVEEHSVEQTADPGPEAKAAQFIPSPALWAFLLVLGALFAGAYGVGEAVGPVAPGMHGPGITGDTPASDGDMPMEHGGGQ
ncbi:hypothetical protein [Streptomyces sp. NBC_00893]|uniref:hypothetical protein n=1 Tax=Streptomyces sp. NBC_00893 TaxID=2975862 RepID=UPI00224CDFC8|nr:hypothetical protein [Streptomyces sp. NBC_00893]MCX4852167.1 hypothetical protein [Streptomyces sp. NBC_00893]